MVVAGDAPAVFDDDLPIADLLDKSLLLRAPVAVDIGEGQILIGDMELGGMNLLDLNGLLTLVSQHHTALHQVIPRMQFVVQIHVKLVVLVFEVKD